MRSLWSKIVRYKAENAHHPAHSHNFLWNRAISCIFKFPFNLHHDSQPSANTSPASVSGMGSAPIRQTVRPLYRHSGTGSTTSFCCDASLPTGAAMLSVLLDRCRDNPCAGTAAQVRDCFDNPAREKPPVHSPIASTLERDTPARTPPVHSPIASTLERDNPARKNPPVHSPIASTLERDAPARPPGSFADCIHAGTRRPSARKTPAAV